jgi:hypothetical protein
MLRKLRGHLKVLTRKEFEGEERVKKLEIAD